jgi:1,4-alpha-glucan branching enzyme
MGNMGGAIATNVAAHGRPHSLSLALPPVGVTFFESDG